MYELNVTNKNSIFKFDYFVYKSKSEILDWMNETNINIRFKLIFHHRIFNANIDQIKEGNYIDIEIHMFDIINTINLIFYTEEDRNLFKLTWM